MFWIPEEWIGILVFLQLPAVIAAIALGRLKGLFIAGCIFLLLTFLIHPEAAFMFFIPSVLCLAIPILTIMIKSILPYK